MRGARWLPKGQPGGAISASSCSSTRSTGGMRRSTAHHPWQAAHTSASICHGKGLGSATSAGASTTPRISIAPTHDKHMGSLDVASASPCVQPAQDIRPPVALRARPCGSSSSRQENGESEADIVAAYRQAVAHQSASSPTWRAVVFPVCSPVLAASRNESRKVCARLLPRSHCWAFRITKLLPPRGASARGALAWQLRSPEARG